MMPDFVLATIVLGWLWLCLWRERWWYLGLLPVVLGMLYPLYTTKPDFFIAPHGKEWAARLEDGRLAVSNIKRDKFAVEQWRQRLGMVDVLDAKGLPPDNKEIRCDDEGCVYRRGAFILAMPIAETAALEDCEHANVVIAPFIITSCAAQQVIDEQALAQHGAHAIYFDGDKARVEFTRKTRGARPWSAGWRSGEEKGGG